MIKYVSENSKQSKTKNVFYLYVHKHGLYSYTVHILMYTNNMCIYFPPQYILHVDTFTHTKRSDIKISWQLKEDKK